MKVINKTYTASAQSSVTSDDASCAVLLGGTEDESAEVKELSIL